MVKSLKAEGEYRHGKHLKKKSIGRGGVNLSRPLRPNFCQGFPPMGELVPRPWGKKFWGSPHMGGLSCGDGLLRLPLRRGART